MKSFRSKCSCVLPRAFIASLTLLAGGSVHAQNGADSWTGATATWNTSGNWTGANEPPISGDSLVFGAAGAGGLTLNNNLTSSTFSVAGITFNSSAGAYVIGGNAFALTGAVTNDSASLETIDDAFSMAATETFTMASGNITLGGIVSGAGGIATTGTGTLTLTAANTFTGAFAVNGGTVTIGGSGTLGAGNYGGAVVLASGATFNYGTSTSGTMTGAISGAGSVDVSGTGTLTLTGKNSWTGNTTIGSGSTLDVAAEYLSTGASTSTITIANNGTLDFTSNHAQEIAFQIAGSGNLISDFSNAYLNINTANTFTGTTTLGSGMLEFTGAGALGSSGMVIGGNVILAGTSTTAGDNAAVGSLTVNSGLLATVENTGKEGFSLGAVSRSAGGGMLDFVNTSTGTITTTTANTNGILGAWAYTGTTTGLNYATAGGGGVIAAVANTADDTGALSTVTTGTGNFTTGTASNTSTGVVSANTLRFAVTGAATWNNSGGATLNGLMNAGTGSLTINGGTITIGDSAELDIVTNGQNITVGSAIADNGSGASSVVVGSVGGPSTTTYTTVSGGTTTLTGVNTYTGGTYINNGTLAIGGAGQLGSGSYAGAILDNGTLAYGSSAAQTLSGAITGSGGIIDSGAGALTLSSSGNTYTGDTTVSAGTLVLADGVGLSASGNTITLAGGNLQLGNGSTSGNVNSYSLVFTSSGTLTNGNSAGTETLTLTDTAGGTTGGFIQVNSGLTGTIASGVSIAGGAGGQYFDGGGTLNIAGTFNDSQTTEVEGLTLNITGTYLAPYLETVGAYDNVINVAGGTVILNDAVILNNGTTANTDYSVMTIGGTYSGSGATGTFTATNTGGSVTITGLTGTGSPTHNYVNLSRPGVANVNSYLFLESGTLTTGQIYAEPETVVQQTALYFNGGTLTADASEGTNFMYGIGSAPSGGSTGTYTGPQAFAGEGGLAGYGGVYIGGTNGGGGAFIGTGTYTNAIEESLLTGNGIAGSSAYSNTGGQTDGGLTVEGPGSGSGTLTLAYANTYNGGTTITGNATVVSANANGLGASGGDLNINNGGVLDIDDIAQTVGAVTLGTGGSTIQSSGGTQTLTAGSVSVNGAGNIIAGSAVVDVSGNTTLNADSGLEVDGALTQTGASTVVIGPGATLSGTGTVTGATSLAGGNVDFGGTGDITGTLSVTGGNWNGAGGVSGPVNVTSGDFNIGTNADLAATGGVNVSGGAISSTDATGTITGSIDYTSTSNSTYSGVIAGAGSSVTMNSAGATLNLGGANTYGGGTTVSAGTLQLSNGSGSATGSGALNVGANAVLAGTGLSSGSSFGITGSGSAVATVLVGHNNAGDINTTGVMSLQATGASSIGAANLVFNIDSSVAGQGNQLNVGATAITFNTVGSLNTTLTLNVEGGGFIPGYTTYVLVAGTGATTIGDGGVTSGQYAGLTTFLNSRGQEEIETGPTSNLSLAFSSPTQAGFYSAQSYLFLVDNGGVDDIDVEVVPEPGTWAMMLGGLAMLLVWQRRRNERNRV